MKNTNIAKKFAKYVTLNIFGMIGLSCYILADTFFVARGIGVNGLTALNLAIPIYSFIHGAGLMVGMGGATRFSISRSPTVFTQSLYFILILSGFFVTIGVFFSGGLASLLGANFATLEMTSTYLQIILCFSPMFMLNNLILCFIRNDGNPKLPMQAMLIGSLSNIILDYIFVFPLQMGMFGAALATGTSPIISLLVLSLHFVKKNNSFMPHKTKLHPHDIKDISMLGSSALITELSSGIVMIIFNSIILKLSGNVGVAAYGIVANIALVVISIFTGISHGSQPLISDSYGRGEIKDVKKLFKYGGVTAILFAVGIYIVTFIFAEPIVSAFNKEQNLELAKIAIKGLRIYFVAFVFVGFNVLTATYFCSCDEPKKAFLISMLRGFIVIIPTTFLLSAIFGMVGIWCALAVSELIVFAVAVKQIRS